MSKQELKQLIIDTLESMNIRELISVHNEYCYNANYYEDEIIDIDRADEIFDGHDAYWLFCRVYYGKFDPSADYFTLNGYGNIESVHAYQIKNHVYMEDIADYCIDNETGLYNDEIQDLIDTYIAVECRAADEKGIL